mgnify:CR=1 FL=1
MSSIDYEESLSGLVKSVRSQVGHLLSDLQDSDDGNGNSIKAVIQDIQDGVRPEYPYIVITHDYNDDASGSWKRHSYIDDQDDLHILSEEELRFNVTCYGDNSVNVLKALRTYALDDYTRAQMNISVNGVFTDYTAITRKPVYLSTDFINTATMTALFTSVSDTVITGGGVIERVIGEESYLQTEDDNNTISIPLDTDF